MSALPTMPPELTAILQEALADAHHAVAAHASRGDVATCVIAIAEKNGVAAVIEFMPTIGVNEPLIVLRGLAAMLYSSEQNLLAKVDILEERVEYLRTALTQIAMVNRFETMAAVRQFAKDILEIDDGLAGLDDAAAEPLPPAATSADPDELPDPIARVRAAVIQAQSKTGVALARGPIRQNACGKLTDNPAHVVAATPMGLILQASDPSLRGPAIVRAAAQACILIEAARAIDAGFRGEACPDGGVETWHALGTALAADSGLPLVYTEEA